jgi:hypothetical protein
MAPTPISRCAGGTGVKSGRNFKAPSPLCTCCAAQPNFAELHAHTSRMSNVGQRFLDFYISAGNNVVIKPLLFKAEGPRSANRTQPSLGKSGSAGGGGLSIGLLSGGRTRGVKSNRMTAAYPELQALLKERIRNAKPD